MSRPERIMWSKLVGDTPTVSSPGSRSPAEPAEPPRRQFLPGTQLGKRYRIVELLGRGGMGEVYRADDLQLGQTVALKFLPEHLTDDPTALARLRNEVRVARQISHANVCRVYDIGEADGHYFLSMEYVDGEDLGSVLRRLGRPTPEKSIEIARQLCAGLAAAHETGVLHRDLKPANVMIDGRGRVRITDFGLAGFSRELVPESHGGTPSYMAPELFAGGVSSARTDIYTLGAVLYELFTGRRAFEAATILEMRRLQENGRLLAPSEIVHDLEPVIEQIILRCLDPSPAKRPVSALAVAAVLPGQDLVAIALAAGQTPSPEMVAAAGGEGALRPAIAAACLASVVAGLVLIAGLDGRVALHGLTPPAKPTVVLEDLARGILDRLGAAPPADTASGWETYDGYLEHVADTDTSPDRWSRLRGRRPPVHWLWYRESPVPMYARNLRHEVSYQDPPSTLPGMAGVKLDDLGRIAVLQIVPPQVVPAGSPEPEPYDYGWLFEAAGLELADFREVEPRWTPPDYADARRAWEGHYPEQPDWPVRVETASFGGSPIYFNVLEKFDQPWRGSDEELRPPTERAAGWVYVGLLIVSLGIPPLVARRNLRRGNGDLKGAVRLGVTVCMLALVSWAFVADHVAKIRTEVEMLFIALGLSLLIGVWSALIYLALEPYVRRGWPETMISWTRLLMGRFRDPRVGRDVLIGALSGVLVIVIQRVEWLVPTWFGVAPRRPFSVMNALYLGGRKALAEIVQPFMLSGPLLVLLVLIVMLFVLRRHWLAVVGAFAVFAIVDEHWMGGGHPVVQVAAVLEVVAVWSILLFTLIRFGLLSLAAAFFFLEILQTWPLTLDTSQWFAGTSTTGLLVLTAIAVLATRTSIGTRISIP